MAGQMGTPILRHGSGVHNTPNHRPCQHPPTWLAGRSRALSLPETGGPYRALGVQLTQGVRREGPPGSHRETAHNFPAMGASSRTRGHPPVYSRSGALVAASLWHGARATSHWGTSMQALQGIAGNSPLEMAGGSPVSTAARAKLAGKRRTPRCWARIIVFLIFQAPSEPPLPPPLPAGASTTAARRHSACRTCCASTHGRRGGVQLPSYILGATPRLRPLRPPGPDQHKDSRFRSGPRPLHEASQ
jgi:hypothetical protein